MRLPPGLVAITPGTLDARSSADLAGSIVRAVERAAEAGLRGVLVREPGLTDAALIALVRGVRTALERVHPGEGWLGLHDRVHLARTCAADAVHLGFRSLPPADARVVLAALDAQRAIALGLSAHAHDDPSAWEAADYLFFGPVLETPSKRGLVAATGFDGLARAVERARPRPVLALGGLAPEHARNVRATGAHGLAVLRGVLGAEDPAQAFLEYVSAWKGGAP